MLELQPVRTQTETRLETSYDLFVSSCMVMVTVETLLRDTFDGKSSAYWWVLMMFDSFRPSFVAFLRAGSTL